MSVASPTGPLNNTNMNKINIIGAIAVIALVFAVFASFHKDSSGKVSFGANASNIPAAGSALPNSTILPNPSNFDYITTNSLAYIGAALGLGNGTSVPEYQQTVRSSLTAATTTPCNLQSPFTATSTVINFTMNVTTGTTTTGAPIFAVATAKNATTTVIAQGVLINNGALATLGVDGVASSTGQLAVVAPSGWAAVGFAGTTTSNGIYTYGGTCEATFVTAN